MYADCAVNFSALSEQVAQCKVGFNGITVNLQHPDKDVNGLVLLFTQQVIQALDVVGTQHGISAATGFTFTAFCGKPAKGGRNRQQEPEQILNQHNGVRKRVSARGRSACCFPAQAGEVQESDKPGLYAVTPDAWRGKTAAGFS